MFGVTGTEIKVKVTKARITAVEKEILITKLRNDDMKSKQLK